MSAMLVSSYLAQIGVQVSSFKEIGGVILLEIESPEYFTICRYLEDKGIEIKYGTIGDETCMIAVEKKNVSWTKS